MAKHILWFSVIALFLSILISYYNGGDVGQSPKILMWSILGVLALCESIEKLKK